MAIYRGPGGSGDATADSANTAQVAEQFSIQAGISAATAAANATTASNAATAAQAAQAAAETAETNAETAETNAETAETNAETAQAAAEAARDAALAAQTAAELAETNAETAETNAETAETNAEAAQAAAEAAQLAAENAQTGAEAAETGALAAQAAAESARDSALAAYDNFDDRYLGQKTSNPTVDNDGNALVAGALYFNTVDNAMRVYTGTVWVDAYAAGQTFLAKANNLSDLTNVATARQNLDLEIGVDVQAYDATILKSADIGVTVQGYDVDTAKYDATTANFTGTLQNGGSNVIVDSDIGSTVQAYDSNLTSFVSTFTLPTTDGTADQVLKTNGSGTLSFVTPAAAIADGDKGDITVSSSGATWTIDDDAVTQSKIADAVYESFAFRNRIINGGFAIDQRNNGASTAVADDVYCFDRWYVLTQTASVNVSRQSTQENGIPFNIRLTQNQASAQRMGLAQIIEGVNCRDLRGSSVVLNLRMRTSASQAIRYAILEWTGTEDSVTSDVVNSWTNSTYTAGQFFIGTTTTVTSVGSITPSANTWTSLSVPLTGTIGSSTNNITVFVWTEGTAAQNFTLDLANAQLEVGSVATPFERRDYGRELLMCQRYYESWGGDNAFQPFGYFEGTGTIGYAVIQYLVQKRASPTVTVSAAGDFQTIRGGTVFTAFTFSSASLTQVLGSVTSATNFTAGDIFSYRGNNTTAARIRFSSEL